MMGFMIEEFIRGLFIIVCSVLAGTKLDNYLKAYSASRKVDDLIQAFFYSACMLYIILGRRI